MANADNKKKGVLLALIGVLILSPDSLLVRLLEVPFFTLMFWRGFFMFLCLTLFIMVDRKKSFWRIWQKLDKHTLAVGVLFAMSTYLFVLSLLETSVAHTLLIVGTSPVFTALFAWLLLKELVQFRVWMAILVIVMALFFVIQQQNQASSVQGDVYALISSLIMGYIFVFVRKHNHADLILGLSVSGLIIAVLSFFLASDNSLLVELDDAILLLILGASVGAAFSLITLSARYIAAPITGMFMPLETVIGVFLVWLFVGEQPSLSAIVGGVVIILALVYISIFELKKA